MRKNRRIIKRERYFVYILIISVSLYLLYQFYPSYRMHFMKSDYKLVNKFFSLADFDNAFIKRVFVFNYFFFNNIKTKFNVDLVVCINMFGKIINIQEIDIYGIWHEKNSLPLNFSSEQLEEEIYRSEKAPKEFFFPKKKIPENPLWLKKDFQYRNI